MEKSSIEEEVMSNVKGSYQEWGMRKFGNNVIYEITIHHTGFKALVKTICAKIFRAYRGLYSNALRVLRVAGYLLNRLKRLSTQLTA